MKKLLFLLISLVFVSVINAQTLEEIVKKYTEAMKLDQLAKVQTIKITGKMSGMGMELPITMYMKNPNKIKSVTNFGGQDMVSVYDGEKGYMINPMQGPDPVELTGDQLKQVQNNNAFTDQMVGYYKQGILSLEGSEDVNGKPAFKLKANIEGGKPVYLSIDKDSYLLVKTSSTVNQAGQEMVVDSFLSDYFDNQGVMLPKKTTASSGGMEMMVLTFDKIEVNVPIDDSVFKVK